MLDSGSQRRLSYSESTFCPVVMSGYELEDTPYGKGISIKNADGLHQAIGMSLVRNKKLLSGKEVRFLRHRMDLTQSELGKLFGTSTQQVARYEKEECEMPGRWRYFG
jgi:DNA-binding transcriptional regulator YiaG